MLLVCTEVSVAIDKITLVEMVDPSFFSAARERERPTASSHNSWQPVRRRRRVQQDDLTRRR